MKNENFKFWVNENGMLAYSGETTLKRYFELKDKQYHYHNDCIFYAFNDEQYDEGLRNAQKHMQEGEKIMRGYGGAFGTARAFREWIEFIDDINKKIANECDPQEVYVYENNNHESCINYEGDTEAIGIIIDTFGEDVARTIKRKYIKESVDQIIMHNIKVLAEGLTYNNGETPLTVWFDDEKKAWTMSGCVLYAVMKDGEQFEATDDKWVGMTASYKDNYLFRWRKE